MKKKLWTIEDPLTDQEQKIIKEIKKEDFDAAIKKRQEEKIPDLRPSEVEEINRVIKKIQGKFIGKALTPDLQKRIEKEITEKLIDVGFHSKIEWVYESSLQSYVPQVEITKRTQFDIDEVGKLIHETRKRGGYKLKE